MNRGNYEYDYSAKIDADTYTDSSSVFAGTTVMAGELSLIAAISAGHLAKAHQELGR